MMRRSLLRALAGMVYGGLPAQRPDQVVPSSSAGVAPGSATGVFRGRTVIVSGTGAGVGFFEYAGTPGLGNQPIAYAVPPGVTADPFGNTLPATGGGFTAVGSLGNIVQMMNGSVNFISNVTTTPGSVGIATGDTRVVLASGQSVAKPGPGFFAIDAGTGTAGEILAGVLSFCISPTLAPPSTSSLLEVQGSVSVVGANLQTTGLGTITASGGLNAGVGNVDVPAAGAGLRVAEGANAKQGTAVLVAGTLVVANTSVTAVSRIFLTCQVPGGAPGFLRVSARTPGTSFTILSSSATDTSTVAFEIFEPG